MSVPSSSDLSKNKKSSPGDAPSRSDSSGSSSSRPDRSHSGKPHPESPRTNKSSLPSTLSPRRDGLDHVVVRNTYAFVMTRRAIMVLLVSVICALLSMCTAEQVLRVHTPPQFVQLTQDGRIMPVAPLSVRSVSDGEILKFASDSVKWINTYDYLSWRDQLQEVADRFSPNGWNNYLSQLVRSDNMNSVRSQHMVVSAVFKGSPVIKKQGVVQSVGAYVWLVDVPALIRYSPPPQNNQQPQTIDQVGIIHLYIARVPLQISQRGYAIEVYQFEGSSSAAAVGK